MESPRRRTAAIALGALLVAIFAIVAVAQGIGHPSPGGEEVAVVEDAENGDSVAILQSELDAALDQVAARQGLDEAPEPDDPQYETIRDSAFSDLLLSVWVRGEAEERGVEASESEIEDEFENIREQQFEGNERRFQRFLEESGFTEEQARERLELQVLSDGIQSDVLPDDPEVTDEEVETFYNASADQFEQPASRTFRQLLIEDEGDADEAAAELEQDSSAQVWNRLARRLSIDEQTRERGGLMENVVEGQIAEEALEDEVFNASVDEIVGPFEGAAGSYVIQVEEITPARTVALEEAEEQIRQTLRNARQQEIAQEFQQDFLAKWRSRTFCAEGYVMERCANFEPPAFECPEDVADEQGCPAPVPSTRPIEPGTATTFGEPAPFPRPQGPLTPAPDVPEGLDGLEGLPEGFEQMPEGAPPAEAPPPQEPPAEEPPAEQPPAEEP